MSNKERINSGITGYAGLEVRRAQRLIKEKGVIPGLRSVLPGAIDNLCADALERLAEFFKNKVLRFSHSFSLVKDKLFSDRFGQARDFINPSLEEGMAMIEFREVGYFFWKLGKRTGQVVSSYYDCYGRLPGIFLRSYTKEENSQKVEQKNIYLRITQEESEKLQEKISQRMETQELKNDKGETVGKFFVTDREENFLDLKDVAQMLKTTLSPQRQEELSGWLANLEKVAAKEKRIKTGPQLPAYIGEGIGAGGNPSGIFFEREESIRGGTELKRITNSGPLGPDAVQVNFGLPSLELVVKESLTFSPQSKIRGFSFREKSQIKQVELPLAQPNILATEKLHNLPRSLENVQPRVIGENGFVEENEEIFVKEERKEERALETEQPEVVEMAAQPAVKKEAVTEVSTYVHPGGVDKEERESKVAVDQSREELLLKEPVEKETVVAEREEVVVFEAAEPAIEPVTELVVSVMEPFVFIRKEPILPPVEEVVLPILIVPSFGRVEQAVHIEEETSKGVIQEMIEKEVTRREEHEETTEARKERLVLPKVEVWTPRIFPLNLFSPERKKTIPEVSTYVHPGGVNSDIGSISSEWYEPSWIELLPPKEISLITALARDKFGINYSHSFATLADLTLFWLAAMSLFAQKPTLYKLELDLSPLTVKVEDGKILVARRVIPEEILGREDLLVEGRQFFPRPFLFLTV